MNCDGQVILTLPIDYYSYLDEDFIPQDPLEALIPDPDIERDDYDENIAAEVAFTELLVSFRKYVANGGIPYDVCTKQTKKRKRKKLILNRYVLNA